MKRGIERVRGRWRGRGVAVGQGGPALPGRGVRGALIGGVRGLKRRWKGADLDCQVKG